MRMKLARQPLHIFGYAEESPGSTGQGGG